VKVNILTSSQLSNYKRINEILLSITENSEENTVKLFKQDDADRDGDGEDEIWQEEEKSKHLLIFNIVCNGLHIFEAPFSNVIRS